MKKSLATLVLAVAALISALPASAAEQNPRYRRAASRRSLDSHSTEGSAGQASSSATQHLGEVEANVTTKNGDGGFGAGGEAKANIYRAEVNGEHKSAEVKQNGVVVLSNEGSAKAEIFVGAQATAEAGIEFGKDPSLKAEAGVFIGQKATVEGSTRSNVLGAGVGASGAAEVSVGADAQVGASLSREGLSAEASAFAGERAKAEGGVDLLGVGAKGEAEGWAGVGAEGKLEGTFKNGKVSVSTEAGAGLLVGGKAGVDLTVDVNQATEEGIRTKETIEAVAPQIQRDAEKTAQQISTGTTQAAQQVSTGATQAAQQVSSGTTQAAQQVSTGVNKAGSTVKKFFGGIRF